MKKPILIAAICLLLASALAVGIFWYCHPTHFLFNDRYVLGNTRENIIAKYGQPDRTGSTTMTYLIHDNTPELFMSYDDSLWYVIEFENGAAVRVYLQEGYPGG